MNLRIAEPHDVHGANEAARFFTEHVTTDYISYRDLESGRALDLETWRPDLHETLVQEFTSGQVQVWLGLNDETLVALAVVNITEPVAVLQDIVLRERGDEFLTHVLACLRHHGHTGARARSSMKASGAHHFLETMGFVPTHVHFVRAL